MFRRPWFSTMRQSNVCSTPGPRSSAAKQWFEELAQKMKKTTCILFYTHSPYSLLCNEHKLLSAIKLDRSKTQHSTLRQSSS